MSNLLIFPFSMRESINYAIRARLRGDHIIGAASEDCKYQEYCDSFVSLPNIYQSEFEEKFRELLFTQSIKSFYTPHEIVYQHVKKFMNGALQFAEGSPIEIMNEEYRAAAKTGMPIGLVQELAHVYGFMNEEKLQGILECCLAAPDGPVVEIGSAWGKSAMALAYHRTVYTYDPFDKKGAYQESAPKLVNEFTETLDWVMCRNAFYSNIAPNKNIYTENFPDTYSILHIDGNHDYEAVQKDWDVWGIGMIECGWLILDDIDWPGPAKLWSEIKDQFDFSYTKGGALFARRK